MKIIDFETIRKLSLEIAPSDYFDWIDDALRHKADFVMPVKSRITQNDGDYYAIMPCLYEKDNVAMVKMIGRHALKEGELRPVMMSDLLLYEGNTGVLKAVMDAEYITTLRTGAVAAHAAILYGKPGFNTIGLIGLGNIMTACMHVLLSKITDRRLTLKLHKYNGHENRLKDILSKYENVEFVFCDTYEETIGGSDVVISAVTRVTENFCDDRFYDAGCTVIPIMTLGFQNCDLFFDQVFTDEIDQIRGFKYFDRFHSLKNTSDVLNGTAGGRASGDERILVYNYGLATLDLYFAKKFYDMSFASVGDSDYRWCTEKFFM